MIVNYRPPDEGRREGAKYMLYLISCITALYNDIGDLIIAEVLTGQK